MNHTASNLTPLLNDIVAGIYQAYPTLLSKYGEAGKKKCLEDNQHHLAYLALAYKVQDSKIFSDYAIWLDGVLTTRGMDTEHLILNLELIQEAAQKHLPGKQGSFYVECIEKSVNRLKETNDTA